MGSNLRKWQLPALISLGMSFFWLLLRRGHIALFFAPVETGAGLPGPYLAAVVLALAVALADALAQGFFSRIVVRHAWILVFVGGISAVLGLVAGILGSESPLPSLSERRFAMPLCFVGLRGDGGTLVSERLSRRVIVAWRFLLPSQPWFLWSIYLPSRFALCCLLRGRSYPLWHYGRRLICFPPPTNRRLTKLSCMKKVALWLS